jgi:hypothetical protein
MFFATWNWTRIKNGPIPLQVWEGVAQAVADFSGYRISIQAAVFGPVNEEGALHLIEEREVASGEPVFFRKPLEIPGAERLT